MSGSDRWRPEDWLDGYGTLDPDGRFTEFQRVGLDAASTIMARFAEFWQPPAPTSDDDGAVAGTGPFGARAGGPAGDGRSGDPPHDARAEAARSLDTVLDMTRKLFESSLDLADAALRRPHLGTWLADGDPGPDSGLSVRSAPGGRGAASAWVHHRGATAGPVRFEVTELRAAGRDAAAASVTVTPARVAALSDGDRVELTVTVDVDDATAPGTYHGLVLADGLPDAALALRLVVS
jgi:hypothetical protein